MLQKSPLKPLRTGANPSPNVHLLVVTALLVGSVALNVGLSLKLRQLTAAWEAYRNEGRLAVGTAVPALRGKDLGGADVSLTYGEGEASTVLYVFSPQCNWCTRNLNNMTALAGAVRGKYRFVGLSLSKDKLAQYVSQNRLEFPVYADIPADVLAAYHLGATPQTLVISPEGRVERSWTGAYIADTGQEVEQYFKVKLPGVVER